MPKESTKHAVSILTGFISQLGGAQGALLELKYGHFQNNFDMRVELGALKDSLLSVKGRIEKILEEVE